MRVYWGSRFSGIVKDRVGSTVIAEVDYQDTETGRLIYGPGTYIPVEESELYIPDPRFQHEVQPPHVPKDSKFDRLMNAILSMTHEQRKELL